MDASITAKQTYAALRQDWSALFGRQKQIVGLLDEILKSKNIICTPKHEDSKKALEGLTPQTPAFNLQKIAINQKQIQDMMVEAEEFQKKREQIDAEKQLDQKIQNEKLDPEQKRRKRLLSSGTFKHLQYLESEEWGKLDPTKSPQSRRRSKTPKALVTNLEKELESFEDSLQQFNSLQKDEPAEELLDVGTKVALSPSDWTGLEPVRRRNRISKCRRFIQQNVTKNNWLADELNHLMINEPTAPEAVFDNNNHNNNNTENEDEPQLELLSLEDTKKVMQNLTSKLKILKQQYADEAKKSLQYRNEVMRVETEKLDLVEHFSSLLERKDIELSFLQSQSKDPEDDLGTTYYDDLQESTTSHPPQEVHSPNLPKPPMIQLQQEEDQDIIEDDAEFLDLLEQKQKQNETQGEVDFDLLDLEDEEEFKLYLDKISEKDTQPEKAQDAKSLYNQLFATNNNDEEEPVSEGEELASQAPEDELASEEEPPAKPNEEGAAYPYVQEQDQVPDEEIISEGEASEDEVIDPDMVNLDSENDLDWLLEKVQQGEDEDSSQDITVS